tara:strand:- start:77 stop:499 length:423 start_codon:yes stop_codon:yes gene_type:complete
MDNFVIVNKHNDSLFSEPSRPSWKGTSYKSEGAAKAGITRTIKFYEKAVADVERVLAEGEKDYTSRMYNAYRDATDPALGRTHKADRDNYRVMDAEEYALIEPMITKTGKSPYNGKTITRTLSINTPSYMDPLCESHYTR